MRANRTVARGLNISDGTMVQQVDTLRLVDDRPLVVTSHYYPLPRFDGIAETIRQTGSVTAALSHFGVEELTHVLCRISARAPTQKESRLLGQPGTKPVLCTLNSSVDQNDRYVQFTIARFAASLIELTVFHNLAHHPH